MSKHNNKSNSGRTALFVLLALILVAAVAAFVVYSYIKNYDKPVNAENTKEIDIVVPSGSSTTSIAKLLEKNGIIANADIFKLKAKLNKLDGKFQAGEYTLTQAMGMNEIMTQLQNAKRETVRFTIKEGLSLRQIGESLEKQGICTKADFLKSLEEDDFDFWFVKELTADQPDPTGQVSAQANRLEGFLFPDTYEVYVGSSARTVIKKMLAQFDKVFGAELKAKLAERKMTLKEAMTVASLIEREIVLDSERPLCASVIYNRLNGNATGKKLQFCSTILYCLGNPEGKTRVLFKDLETDNPYNTYKNPGLPPGPICCPGKACIEAALNPAETKYLYFVVNSNGKGGHKFSSNYSDHTAYSEEYLNTINK